MTTRVKPDPLYFVHITDSHIGASKDLVDSGINAHRNIAKVVGAINSLPTQPKFVIHTGDVVRRSESIEDSYELAAEVFAELDVPIYFAVGNHDRRDDMRRCLPMGTKEDIPTEQNELCYKFMAGGERFVVLDSQLGGDEFAILGELTDEQLDFVRNEAADAASWISIFVHHSPLDIDSKWYREKIALLNGDALHDALLPAREHLRGVFFGHIHRGAHVHKDGIAYVGVASTFCQFDFWPHDGELQVDLDHPPCFNFVTYMSDRVIVKEHSVSRD